MVAVPYYCLLMPLGSVRIEGGGRGPGLEGSKVKLIENRLIWDQFYSTPPLPLNPNRPLVNLSL